MRWSFSKLKRFNDCQAKAMAIEKGEWKQPQTSAMLAGQYFDLFFREDKKRQEFETLNNVFKKNGERYADFEKAYQCFLRVLQDKKACEINSGHQQIRLEGIINGVEWIGFADTINDDMQIIVDRKLIKDIKPIWADGIGYVAFWKEREYQKQLAIYQYLFEQNSGLKYKSLNFIATKEAIPELKCLQYSQALLDDALCDVIAEVETHNKAMQENELTRCETCDYCKSTKKIEIEIIEG